MTTDMIVVMAVLVAAILMFIFEWVRVDVVGIITIVTLPILGLVTPQEAISGLSSNAVVSIIAVIILGAGLDKTGAMNSLARVILRFAGKSESRIVTIIAGTVALISSFMQNIGAAALFMPAAIRIGRQTGIPVSRILMPMGFCAIIGGCITLIGSSPLILMNDVMRITDPTVKPFGLFSVTPVGLALTAGAIIYFILFGRFILPSSKGDEGHAGPMSPLLSRTYKGVGTVFELHIPETFKPASLIELGIRPKYFTSVVAIAPEGKTRDFSPNRNATVSPGDSIAVVGPPDLVERMAEDLGWELQPELSVFAEDLSPNNAGILEAVVTARSELIGKTLTEVKFRNRYGINPLALLRRNRIYIGGLSDIELAIGDALLLHGRWEKFHPIKEKPDLVFTEAVPGEVMRTEKLKYALICLGISLTMVLVFNVRLSIALLAGALGMVLTKVMSIDEAYQSVDWMTVFLLGGLIPLGIAFQKTGTAKYIADTIMNSMGQVSPIILYTVVGLLTSFFTLVVSNVGAAVLMIPLSMHMAVTAGADPRLASLVVGVACSNTFILPTHQVNALIMRPGGYRTIDYFKAGSGMTILYLIIMVACIYLFY